MGRGMTSSIRVFCLVIAAVCISMHCDIDGLRVSKVIVQENGHELNEITHGEINDAHGNGTLLSVHRLGRYRDRIRQAHAGSRYEISDDRVDILILYAESAANAPNLIFGVVNKSGTEISLNTTKIEYKSGIHENLKSEIDANSCKTVRLKFDIIILRQPTLGDDSTGTLEQKEVFPNESGFIQIPAGDAIVVTAVFGCSGKAIGVLCLEVDSNTLPAKRNYKIAFQKDSKGKEGRTQQLGR